MARPRRTLTEEEKIQVEALAACLTVEQMADYFGMAKETFYNICERDEEVLRRYKRGRANVTSEIASSLIMKARDGDTPSIMFYLKTQAGWREKEKEKDVQENNNDVASLIKELVKCLPD